MRLSRVSRMATFRRISPVRRFSSSGSDAGTDPLSAMFPITSSTSLSASWNRFVHCSNGDGAGVGAKPEESNTYPHDRHRVSTHWLLNKIGTANHRKQDELG